MKKLILALTLFAGVASAQVSQCFQPSTPWYPCSLLPQVGIASTSITAVSATNGSTAITSSALFTSSWTNVVVSIDGSNAIISSCSSTSACTLGSNFGGTTTTTGLMIVWQIAANSGPSSSTATTLTQPFPNNTTHGNSIACPAMESAAAAPTITDGQDNTYNQFFSSTTAAGFSGSLALNIVGGSTNTITETSSAGTLAFVCYELVGAVQVGQVWDLNQIQQGTGTTIQFTGVLATVPGEMVFGMAGFATGQTLNATPTLGAANTNLVTVDVNNTTIGGTGTDLKVVYAAHTTLNTAIPFTPSFALSGSVVYTGIIFSIRPASPVPPLVSGGICNQVQQTFYAVNVSAETQIAAGSAGKVFYVCRLSFPPQANAVNVSFNESATSGNACATSPTALYGSGTSTTAFNIVANGGWIDPPNPSGQPLFQTAAGDAFCINPSAQITGGIWGVQQ